MRSPIYAVAVGLPNIAAVQVIEGPADMIGAHYILDGEDRAPAGRVLVTTMDPSKPEVMIHAAVGCAAVFAAAEGPALSALITNIIDVDTVEVAGVPVKRLAIDEVLPPAYFVRKCLHTPRDFRTAVEKWGLDRDFQSA